MSEVRENLIQRLAEFLKGAKNSTRQPLLAVVGPTCSGKTGLGIFVAKMLDGEVVSMDSRQVYKGMNIGTAKVTVDEMEGVPHHMIDVVEPYEEFTLAHYKTLALAAIQDIHDRGKIPILVGGTGLYYSAIVDNFQLPKVPANPGLRAELEDLAAKDGVETVHGILEKEDPETARNIHPHNLRYVIRAIEICQACAGKKIDAKGESLFDVFTVAVDWPRDELYLRINERVYGLIENGLLEEVKGLLERGLNRENSVAMASHGYQEVIPYLQGEKSLEECIEEVQKNTRHYAKRQYTWFRRYGGIRWVRWC